MSRLSGEGGAAENGAPTASTDGFAKLRWEWAGFGTWFLDNLSLNSVAGRPVQNDEMQGGRILRNEAYIQYAAM